MKKKGGTIAWTRLKGVFSKYSSRELIGLIRDLYSLNPENRAFINARLLPCGNSLQQFKETIREALYPDIMSDRPIRFSVGRKAINDYMKATENDHGTLELMIYYLECGTNYTVDYGDMWDEFYDKLESMFHRALNVLLESDQGTIDMFLPRLEAIKDKAEGIGWGYYDGLCDALDRTFPEE